MIFNKYVFDNFKKAEILRDKMTPSDPEFVNFDFIATNPMIKDEYRPSYAEKEYIASYLQAVKVLNASINRPVGFKIVANSYSIALPIIYLCRHCIELSIKFNLKLLNVPADNDHKIEKLWSKLKNEISNNQTERETQIIDNMEHFIHCILSVDWGGSNLRYATKQNGSYSQEKLKFANVDRIVDLTEKFVKQLECIAEK